MTTVGCEPFPFLSATSPYEEAKKKSFRKFPLHRERRKVIAFDFSAAFFLLLFAEYLHNLLMDGKEMPASTNSLWMHAKASSVWIENWKKMQKCRLGTLVNNVSLGGRPRFVNYNEFEAMRVDL